MVNWSETLPTIKWTLSVLALSSRFDGLQAGSCGCSCYRLSVLALSSRFDGHQECHKRNELIIAFQYSLCRVVLMVDRPVPHMGPASTTFQYSLCRVVLMVWLNLQARLRQCGSFSTRSVESF